MTVKEALANRIAEICREQYIMEQTLGVKSIVCERTRRGLSPWNGESPMPETFYDTDAVTRAITRIIYRMIQNGSLLPEPMG